MLYPSQHIYTLVCTFIYKHTCTIELNHKPEYKILGSTSKKFPEIYLREKKSPFSEYALVLLNEHRIKVS